MIDASTLPPESLEAERGVLGSIVLHNPAAHEVLDLVAADDFYRAAHQTIFRAIRDLIDAGRPVDNVVLADELGRRGELERVGGIDALVELVGSVPHAAHARYYATIVREKATKRRLIEAADTIRADCYRDDATAAELVERAEGRIFAIGETEAVGETAPLSDCADETVARLERRRAGQFAGVRTGLVDLDDLIDGLAERSLAILAARPSLGKTALALGIAEGAAAAGTVVLFVSLEMGRIELAERLIVGRAGVAGAKVRAGQVRPGELESYRRAAEAVRAGLGRRILVDDTPIRTAGQVAANARRQRARLGVGLVIVDYLQLVDPGPELRKASRQEQVAATSRRFKTLARELGTPILALSQLNRQAEQREDRRPRLADLRESGAIEQDSDMVFLLHRPDFYDPNDQPGIADLIVAKNRNGPTGSIRLVFRPELARFESFAPAPSIGDGAEF